MGLADGFEWRPSPSPRMSEILLCGSDCVRCGACSGDAGDACAFEGSSVLDGEAMGEMCGTGGGSSMMFDESSLASEVAEIFERRGFPAYVARFASEAAVGAACEMWSPCRSDGSI